RRCSATAAAGRPEWLRQRRLPIGATTARVPPLRSMTGTPPLPVNGCPSARRETLPAGQVIKVWVAREAHVHATGAGKARQVVSSSGHVLASVELEPQRRRSPMTDATRFQFTNPSVPKAYDEFLVPRLFEPWAKLLLDEAELRPGEFVLD